MGERPAEVVAGVLSGIEASEPYYIDVLRLHVELLPLFLADALRTYGVANRRALTAAGFDDIPRAGAQIIGRLEHATTTVDEVGTAFGATAQASRLIGTLIERGYVRRLADAEDHVR